MRIEQKSTKRITPLPSTLKSWKAHYHCPPGHGTYLRDIIDEIVAEFLDEYETKRGRGRPRHFPKRPATGAPYPGPQLLLSALILIIFTFP